MKIGLVCPYNIYRGGGVQEVVIALQKGIVDRGHEAYIITPQPRRHKAEAPEGVIFLGGSLPFRALKTQGDVSASVDRSALSSMLRQEDFDILHFHEPWNPMLSLQIMQRSDAVHVATFHAAMNERRASRTVEKVITPYTKSILKYIDVMTAVSGTATSYVGTLTDRKLHIIGNGIDLNKYTPGPEPRGDKTSKTIFYIGRLEKRKGVKYLLEAFAILKKLHPEFKLVIAGDGPERNKLQNFVKDEKIPHVSFLGYLDEQTKLDWLKKADIFCSPAVYGESFGIVLLEAMASGCVVVAGNNPGYESVMQGRGQISLVNPQDAVEFARRLAVMAHDEALRRVWLDWAYEEVKKYDYEYITDQYVKLYKIACSKK
jgi:phosphatidyl-myo-inositol alpha-mannosyltransferase